MAALSNKDFKQGWIDNYFPYTEYTIQDNNLVLGGNVIKVDNKILTEQVIRESTSGFNTPSTIQQTGGNRKKEYKIRANNIKEAFQKLESKVNGKGDILILKLESLDDKNKKNFYKIYRKKI